jgi:hypothetical protein
MKLEDFKQTNGKETAKRTIKERRIHAKKLFQFDTIHCEYDL